MQVPGNLLFGGWERCFDVLCIQDTTPGNTVNNILDNLIGFRPTNTFGWTHNSEHGLICCQGFQNVFIYKNHIVEFLEC